MLLTLINPCSRHTANDLFTYKEHISKTSVLDDNLTAFSLNRHGDTSGVTERLLNYPPRHWRITQPRLRPQKKPVAFSRKRHLSQWSVRTLVATTDINPSGQRWTLHLIWQHLTRVQWVTSVQNSQISLIYDVLHESSWPHLSIYQIYVWPLD